MLMVNAHSLEVHSRKGILRLKNKLPTSSEYTASLHSDKGPSKADRPADSFLPFILPRTPAEGPPGEISWRQKKTMDILPGYKGSPGCGSLEGERAGTGEQILTPYRTVQGLAKGGTGHWFRRHREEIQFGPGDPAMLYSWDTMRSTWALAAEQKWASSRGQWVLRSSLLNYIWKPTQGNSLLLHSYMFF